MCAVKSEGTMSLLARLKPTKLLNVDNLSYIVYVHCEVFTKWQVMIHEEILSLEIFQKLVNDSLWYICYGVTNATLYGKCHSL
jgi:hypothetical protein